MSNAHRLRRATNIASANGVLQELLNVEEQDSGSARSDPKRANRISFLDSFPSFKTTWDLAGVSFYSVSQPVSPNGSSVWASSESNLVTSMVTTTGTVPELLQSGTLMTKASLKKHKNIVLRIDPDLGQIIWESKQQKMIPLENIKEIRSGSDARYYRQQFHLSKDYEDRWLTIIYVLDGAWKILHLIAPTKDIFTLWDRTLRDQHAIRQELMRGLGNLEKRETLWEKHCWKGAGEEGSGKMTFDEIEKLCRALNINSSREDLERMFTQADVYKRQCLDFQDFRRFVKLLKGRPEINRLYQRLVADNKGTFDLPVFEKFLREEQKSTLSRSELKSLFHKYSDDSDATISLASFTSFLLSSDNSPLLDLNRGTWHDMTRPLPDYFISSSHNTYLVGHQLVGDSTIEGYIRALLHGCRSVELDIYDGETEPTIFHGKTLTSKVSLREVCEVISKYGFIVSPYPIIISAEVHCSLPQQDLIAGIMIEVFGDMLLRALPDDKRKIEILPSPEDLKGKILFKTKNPEITCTENSENESGSFSATEISSSTSDSDAVLESLAEGQFSPASSVTKHRRKQSDQIKDHLLKVRSAILQHVRGVSIGSTPPELILDHDLTQSPPELISPTSTSSICLPRTPTSQPTPPRPKPKISSPLRDLLVYTVGVKCRGINKKERYAPEHMFSLSENAANKFLRFHMWDMVKHTKSHLVRIYPKGTRVSSSNYEPHKYWASGAQLVSLNWQTPDLGYMLNHAMFQRNGQSGYVLKPSALRQDSPKDLVLKRTTHALNITIISAQQLPHPRGIFGKETNDKAVVDPYVEVTIHVPDWPVRPPTSTVPPDRSQSSSSPATANFGSSSTSIRAKSGRTSVVKRNGFNPVWEESFSIPFECVGDMFDLIFVKFLVAQEDKSGDEPLAFYCAPLGSLQRGYRHLPLYDSQLSQYLYSTLFVSIDVVDKTN